MPQKTILLQILASDIKETDYSNARDCAITRALQRAGYPDWRDGAYGIHVKGDAAGDRYRIDVVNYPEYSTLGSKVIGMYDKRIPVEDFEFELEVIIP